MLLLKNNVSHPCYYIEMDFPRFFSWKRRWCRLNFIIAIYQPPRIEVLYIFAIILSNPYIYLGFFYRCWHQLCWTDEVKSTKFRNQRSTMEAIEVAINQTTKWPLQPRFIRIHSTIQRAQVLLRKSHPLMAARQNHIIKQWENPNSLEWEYQWWPLLLEVKWSHHQVVVSTYTIHTTYAQVMSHFKFIR